MRRYTPLNRTLNDDRRKIIDFQDTTIEPPGVGIFDAPTRQRAPINQEWDAIVSGAIRTLLTTIAGWHLAQDEGYDGIQQVLQWLASEAEAICTIEDLLEDDDFFNDEYVPQTFGDWYQNTIEHNTELTTLYDGTPQSIGEDIPTGVPNDKEKNALCYAIHSFVRLYASAKVCIIQSKNFLQIAWDEVAEAVNAVYNGAIKTLAFIYTPNLYSCFVDDDEAIIALQDEAAIEELACFLYDELKGVTISQANFDDALLAAATSLSGNAQKIACIMQNDNNLTVYLNFLEAYQIALNRVLLGEALECPCLVATYQNWEWDFSNGLGDFILKNGVLSGGRVTNPDATGTNDILLSLPFEQSWRVAAVRLDGERINGIAHGSQDHAGVRWRPTWDTDTGSVAMPVGGFLGNGVFERCGKVNTTPFYITNFKEASVRLGVSDNSGTGEIYFDKIIIQFRAGFAKGGYLTDVPLCP